MTDDPRIGENTEGAAGKYSLLRLRQGSGTGAPSDDCFDPKAERRAALRTTWTKMNG